MRCRGSLNHLSPWPAFGGVLLLVALAACASGGGPGGAPHQADAQAGADAQARADDVAAATASDSDPTTDGRFDPQAAADLLAQAQAAEAAGRTDAALDLYRQAGLAWPDTLAAWQGLADIAARADRPEEARAAGFMAERVALYPSDLLFVQRDVTRALRSYVEAEEARPDSNPRQLAYAAHLADFYEARYAERGVHEPLDPFFNLEPDEYPTAILTGAGAAAYFGAVFVGD